MKLEAMYDKAYSEKCEPQGVYSMNQFCTALSEEATIDDISDLMKLYYDRAITQCHLVSKLVVDLGGFLLTRTTVFLNKNFQIITKNSC